MSIRTRITALAGAMALAIAGEAQAVKPLEALPALQGLPERWSGVMDLFDVPGMAVAVVKDGEIYVQGFGVRDTATGAKVTPNTIFYIASVTKTYTATGIAALVADGKMSLDDPVKKHLPRLALADSTVVERLTVRDLLCHRYGINSRPAVILDAYTGEITEDRYWYWLARSEVGGAVNYTNVHFTLAGRVIDAVSGEPWRDYLDKRLFTPAGMARTTGYASEMYSEADCATPSERVSPGGEWRAVEQRKTDRTMHAAGGLGTSAVDGARWLLLHLNDGMIDNNRVLPEALVREMRTKQSALEKPQGTIRIQNGFGLAWQVGTFNEHALCSHGGGYVGAGAYMAILPDDDAGIVVLMNAGGPAQGLGDIVAVDLMERLTGTKASWDVYENYTERVKKMKAERANAVAEAGPAVLDGANFSLPLGMYSGWFHNEHLGTLIVEQKGSALTLFLGDLRLEVRAVDGKKNAFQTEEEERGEFVIDALGMVNKVKVDMGTLGTHEFVR